MIAPLLSAPPSLVLASARLLPGCPEAEALQLAGWQVRHTDSGRAARGLVRLLSPTAVVLDTDLPDESGWLTCAKLLSESPGRAVILLAGDISPRDREFARLVGAAGILPRAAAWAGPVQSLPRLPRTPAAAQFQGDACA